MRVLPKNSSLQNLIKNIRTLTSPNTISIMEVCGTHTMSIFQHGIKGLLSPGIKLLSGPGCPVCVTPNVYLDKAIAYSRLKDVVIFSFGDMLKVPGSFSSLEAERSKGADIRVVYSVLEAVNFAQNNPDKKIVFLGVGFETTIPTVAVAILDAKKLGLKNFFVLCGHKIMIPAIEGLLKDKELKLDGLLLPGHVSTIIGSKVYEPTVTKYRIACVIAGFEPLDILEGIYMLARQIKDKKPFVQIQYSRIVRKYGNPKAVRIINKVFEPCDSNWRGIGVIPRSGLKIRKEYSLFDAGRHFKIELNKPKEAKGCICGDVLRAVKTPLDCRLFRCVCTPQNPKGACMVSQEGTCSAYYKYGG